MKITISAFVFTMLFAGAAGAQESSGTVAGIGSGPATGSDSTIQEPEPVLENTERPPRPWSFSVGVSSVFDSNINRDEEDLESYGAVVGLGTKYRRDFSRNTVEFEYEAARHDYTRVERWDRISQRARGMFEREVTGDLTAGIVGEVSLKGSSDDRNIGDQYVLEPSLGYEITNDYKVELYSAMQLRRYPDPGENALYHDTGIELTQELDDDRELGIEVRYEINNEREERGSYRRWRWATKYFTPLGERNDLELELEFRSRRYPGRMVENEDIDVPRRDYRVVPAVEWTHRLRGGLGLLVAYEFEARSSNDPEKSYSGHQLILGLTRWW